ncbi:SDR family NAD(P)-dependent oxidoreductase [Serinibacter arcticus]|uniref:Putative short chain dehydrogenase n=1 Tax=Serinibacter arcticus TaxID=1655435 RepID=A0A4Z1E2U5_9MICO|nr:SDR family NAD(P)-dependent oxidoreductase [Serinibacter arcticus]TGO03961.1 putative short chain dehydrogenase [Serinibacter arcticus]
MPTIAIIGAGPGVGSAVATHFGREGYAVALISRDQVKLDALVAELGDAGITARGYAADVLERPLLRRVLEQAATDLGPIEVLQYSPIPSRAYLTPVLETTETTFAEALAFSALAPIAAVETVLPGMREAGRGTIVFVNGGTSVQPRADFAGTSVAFAAESAYAQILHDAAAPHGVHVTQLVIPGAIRSDDEEFGPAGIARTIWRLHTERGELRHLLMPLEDGRE